MSGTDPAYGATGLFFFALSYSGSNVEQLAAVLKESHLKQDWYRRDREEEDAESAAGSVGYAPTRSSMPRILRIAWPISTNSAVWYHQEHPTRYATRVSSGTIHSPIMLWMCYALSGLTSGMLLPVLSHPPLFVAVR
eukprot:2373595-Rhodomonas_salina.4